MPVRTFIGNAEWNAGIDAQCDAGYRTLTYSGSLGGGTLGIHTQISGGPKVPVSDAKLSAATVDDNNDVVQQLTFRSSGNVFVVLSGATAPNVTVAIQ